MVSKQMSTTEQDLTGFHSWLIRYGRAQKTAEIYCYHIGRAHREGGVLARVVDRELAPKSRHAIMAAGRAYSKFTSDSDLLMELERVRLPAATRQSIKEPLSEEDWFALLDVIDGDGRISDPMRAVLGLMAARGFRVGDALRLHKKEVTQGLKTGILVYEGKLSKRHEISVLDGFRPYLELLDAGNYKQVFGLIAPKRKKPEKSAYDKVARKLLKCAKLAGISPITPHILRHTYARHFLRQLGGDPEAVTKLQSHMQWSKIDTAAQYVGYHRRDALDGIASDMMSKRKR